MEHEDGLILTGENRSTWRKPCTSATFSTWCRNEYSLLVSCPLVQSDRNQNWNVSTDFREIPQNQSAWNEFSGSWAVSLVNAYGRQDFNRRSAGMQTCQKCACVSYCSRVILCALGIPGLRIATAWWQKIIANNLLCVTNTVYKICRSTCNGPHGFCDEHGGTRTRSILRFISLFPRPCHWRCSIYWATWIHSNPSYSLSLSSILILSSHLSPCLLSGLPHSDFSNKT